MFEWSSCLSVNEIGLEQNGFSGTGILPFNSFQQNDSVGVKFARLQETQIPNGNLESIKLLLMFKLAGGKESEWTTSEAKNHGTAMFELLKSSRQTAETQAE